jgi:hypothetical protein
METITKPYPATPTLRVMAFVLLAFICSTTRAQEAPDNNKSGSPYFFVLSNDPAVDSLPLKKQITAEVTQLGLKYNLLTRQTSFIAVEEQIVNTEKALTTVKQPLPLPQGVENSAIGFEMEVEEEMSFSFHKKIVLPTDFDRASKDKVMADVEKNIIPELNRYLRTHAVSLDLIEVTVDEEGRVSNVLIQGKNVSKEARGAILKFIQKQLYTKYKLSREWKFKIVF